MRRRVGIAAAVLVLSVALTGAGCGAEEEPEAPVRDETPVPPRVGRLSSDFDTVYALAEAVVEGVRDGDFDTLWSYRIDEAEWYHIVWPELPASAPGRNLPWDYAWNDLNQKSRSSLVQTIADFRGRQYRLIRVDFAGETTQYDTFRVHRDARCVLEREDGEIVTLDLFGSVIERNGRFKAFSYVVD